MKYQLPDLIRMNFARSRSEAERMVKNGKVRVNGKKVYDAEMLIEPGYDTEIEITVGNRDYKKPALVLEGDRA